MTGGMQYWYLKEQAAHRDEDASSVAAGTSQTQTVNAAQARNAAQSQIGKRSATSVRLGIRWTPGYVCRSQILTASDASRRIVSILALSGVARTSHMVLSPSP